MKKRIWVGIFSAAGLLLLILDTKTALSGAAEGISLCLQTVIPSLFPFFVLSVLLTSTLLHFQRPAFRRICGVLKIPENTLFLFLIGLLSGYPAGAQNVSAAYSGGQLSKDAASKLVTVCNNAGPAFIFGMGIAVLGSARLSWLLWGIQILSAVCLSMLSDTPKGQSLRKTVPPGISLTNALRRSVWNMGIVCGWVVLFRILLSFLGRWIFWMLPTTATFLISGMLELANGCCSLPALPCAGTRLLLFAFFCGFGGLCVTLQTLSVTTINDFSAGKYLFAKLTQGCICLLLANLAQFVLPTAQRSFLSVSILTPVVIICIVYWLSGKKVVAFRKILLYNKEKSNVGR